MAPRPPQRPAPRAAHVGIQIDSLDAADRAIGQLGEAVARLEAAAAPRSRLVVDLAIGANVVVHGLGRVPRHAHITPTVADASYAAALTSADARTATITVIGAAQPGAGVELA